MHIFAIETSCDETSLALVEAQGGLQNPSFRIKKHLIASQIETHRPFGGVVPNLAKREHFKNLPLLFRNLKLEIRNYRPDIVAVTVGPGLEPCLWQGIEFAKHLATRYKIPATRLVGVNHLHGHMYSFLLPKTLVASGYTLNPKMFPAIQLLVSGGHTTLVLMESLTKYKKLGETRDDAAGEAFDKVARMLGLPYPGGPEIERLAKYYGCRTPIIFPRPMIRDKSYDFSFSGLKTAVLYYLRDNSLTAKSDKLKALVAASFQRAVIDVLVSKTMRAAREHGAKSVILSGGVAANSTLQKEFRKGIKRLTGTPSAASPERTRRVSNKLDFLCAAKKYQGDNAAMIAAAGYITHLRGKMHPLEANGSLDIEI